MDSMEGFLMVLWGRNVKLKRALLEHNFKYNDKGLGSDRIYERLHTDWNPDNFLLIVLTLENLIHIPVLIQMSLQWPRWAKVRPPLS